MSKKYRENIKKEKIYIFKNAQHSLTPLIESANSDKSQNVSL